MLDLFYPENANSQCLAVCESYFVYMNNTAEDWLTLLFYVAIYTNQ
jgi:hypothetical protein